MTTWDPDQQRPFLRVAEYWRCDPEANALRLEEGYYSTFEAFGERRRSVALPMGVGLIGRCAQSREPILSESLCLEDDSWPSEAAHCEGLGVSLAIPWTSRSQGRGVLSLFFGHAAGGVPSGGVELWMRSDASNRLGLANAYHGIAEDFRRMSSLFNFELGEGLPGRVAQHELPEALRIAENTREFLRAVAAETSGFDSAIGFPVAARGGSVVVLLSHRQQPIAIDNGIWKKETAGVFKRSMEARDAAFDRSDATLNPHFLRASETGRPITFKRADGTLGQPYGGLVLPFEAADGSSAFCVLGW